MIENYEYVLSFYLEDNIGDHRRCPYYNKDNVLSIAFDIVMFNIDLHTTSSFKTLSGKSSNKHKQRENNKTRFLKQFLISFSLELYSGRLLKYFVNFGNSTLYCFRFDLLYLNRKY